MTIRIVRGRPDDEELVAVLAVLAAATAGPTAPVLPLRRPRWRDPARALGVPAPRGRAAWRLAA